MDLLRREQPRKHQLIWPQGNKRYPFGLLFRKKRAEELALSYKEVLVIVLAGRWNV